MSDHIWAQENLDTYLAGGMTLAERERIEQHVGGCESCAAALKEGRRLNEVMEELFVGVRPDVELDDRLLHQLRHAPRARRFRATGLIRVLAGVAAVVLLGTVGAAMQSLALHGDLPFPGTPPRPAKADRGKAQALNNLKQRSLARKNEKREPLLSVDADPALAEVDTDIQFNVPRMDVMSVPGSVNPNEAVGIMDGPKNAPPVLLPAPGGGGLWSEGNGTKGDFMFHNYTTNGEIAGRVPKGLPLQDTFYGRSGRTKESKESAAAKDKVPEPMTGFQPLLTGLETPPVQLPPLATWEMLTPPNQEKILAAKGGEKLYLYALSNQKPSLPAEPSKTPPPPPVEQPKAGEPKGTNPARPKKEALVQAPFTGEKKPGLESAEPANRKIIRTGEMEFEVDSFDAAVAAATKLINNIKGGFLATDDREKLKNGKMRGWVVVRMPPQFLDGFILDLRRDLGKTAELKHQKIGSQDVTKQYTDIESRLRAARVMEERLLNIIKTGKGEIKDLVAAERELGVARTKIEEMEGEIRYYNNQVSLSTLTMTLTEKEIQTPSALVVSESVKMHLEVDDVDKALKAAVAEVAAVKGRVTKSEAKEQAIGKLEAVVYAEVPAAEEGKFRDSIKKLGIVRHQDAERTQYAEGGSGPPLDLKPRYKDVRFEIRLYNTANIKPRDTFDLQIATLDVPASYRKLQEAVQQAHGQVLTSKLNEQDKLNTTAQFDFDVPTTQKPMIDKLIGEVGQIFARSNNQVPMTEVATDRQVGYRLVLRNVASIPPREKINLVIEVKDVDTKAAELSALVRASKGLVAGSKVEHDENGKATALLVFDVPLSVHEMLVRQFKDAGVLRQQQSVRDPRVPENELAIAHIVVTLVGAGSIVPSEEGVWNQIRAGLYYSFKGFSLVVMWIIVGASVLLPLLVVGWVSYRVVRWIRRRPQTV